MKELYVEHDGKKIYIHTTRLNNNRLHYDLALL
jgi:hypothetical protein